MAVTWDRRTFNETKRNGNRTMNQNFQDDDIESQNHGGYEDRLLLCVECRVEHLWTANDQQFYAAKGFTPPKRCKDCRILFKARREAGGGQSWR
jgi:hypothetical protein